ncbi:MAG: SGNH/GDSL hydrolase family protein [Melioribacteraceae bacterium]
MNKNKIFIVVSIIISSVLFLNCEDRNDITAPEQSQTGNADFTRFVTIGNSLTAGYQSGALYEDGQKYSYGKMIADQVGTSYEQSTVSNPGIGGRIEVKSISPFATSTQPADAGQPTNLGYAGIYNNLGIPGILLADVLLTKESPSQFVGANPLIDVVLRKQGKSVLESALAAQPTFVSVWIGNNDILGYATSGGLLPHTPTATFGQLYTQLIGALAQAGIKGVVANIANVKDVPFFTTVGPQVGLALKNVAAVNPAVKGLVYQLSVAPFIGLATINDLLSKKVFVTLKGSAAAAFLGDATGAYYTSTGVTVPANVDVSKPFGLTPENPFPNGFILDLAEQLEVETVTASFNASIASAATQFGFVLANMNDFFGEVSANGIVENGVSFSTQYIHGGLFSLDGVHPTSQGYAVIANKFIDAINSSYQAKIPKINISTIPGSLELAKRAKSNLSEIPTFDAGTFDGYLF